MGPDFLFLKSIAKVRFFFQSAKKTFYRQTIHYNLTIDNDYIWPRKEKKHFIQLPLSKAKEKHLFRKIIGKRMVVIQHYYLHNFLFDEIWL